VIPPTQKSHSRLVEPGADSAKTTRLPCSPARSEFGYTDRINRALHNEPEACDA
jgi:hypothetical protein